MKQYYELYTIENAVQRINKQLKLIAEDTEKPGVYEKTKKRYLDIEEGLKTSLKYVDIIKKQYDMQASEFEVDYESDPIRPLIIQEIQERLEKLENNTVYFDPDLNIPLPKITTTDSSTYSHSKYASSGGYENVRDATLEVFENVLEFVYNLSTDDLISCHPDMNASIDYIHVKNCAEMIYMWFHARFISGRHDIHFENIDAYMRYIPQVIKGIIKGYSSWLTTNNDELAFKHQIIQWCRDLELSRSCEWGCPQLATCYYKTYDPVSTFTLQSAGIYETLLKIGYHRLTKQEIISSIEFTSKGVDTPLFYLSPDLIVDQYVLHHQLDWVRNILKERSTSSGYLDLMMSCPEFVLG